jgi:hypothetical protein
MSIHASDFLNTRNLRAVILRSSIVTRHLILVISRPSEMRPSWANEADTGADRLPKRQLLKRNDFVRTNFGAESPSLIEVRPNVGCELDREAHSDRGAWSHFLSINLLL